MEKYWFRLFPDTFLWNKNGQSLIYNAKDKTSLPIENTGRVKEVTGQLLNLLNLYCIELSERDLKNNDFKKFIDKVKSTSSGEIIKAIKGEPKPVILPPILSLQSDVERLREKSPQSSGEHILNYLHSIALYLDGTFQCVNSYLFHCSYKTKYSDFLDFVKIKNFLDKIGKSSLSRIDIVAETIVGYPKFNLLINELDRLHLKKNFHVNVSSFENNLQLLNFLKNDQYYLTIFVNNHFRFIRKKIEAVASLIEDNKKQVEWQFLITSEKEYELVTELIEELNLENTDIKPFYTGQNLQFFEDNIYLTEEDLQHPGLSRREVFAHQALNTNDFGKLIVTPNGKVYANLYHEPLGTIDDDVRELVYKEMDKGISWRRIRDMKPCCDCVYQWLCPSPSNYELAIGKPNLCHVKP